MSIDSYFIENALSVIGTDHSNSSMVGEDDLFVGFEQDFNSEADNERIIEEEDYLGNVDDNIVLNGFDVNALPEEIVNNNLNYEAVFDSNSDIDSDNSDINCKSFLLHYKY